MHFPNAFTPNNDHLNDVFQGFSHRLTAFHVFIFDRWGTQVAESSDAAAIWDGTYSNGTIAAAGVYVYYATAQFDDGTAQTYEGNITLIR
ncbi:MAG: gliding motility-associated C-terminal domain-containing protein [Sphingobacteriales bacterium]|nr:gliding motility-associated C-terminal domain-containing protein [Sphingobacteriales bacterium]